MNKIFKKHQLSQTLERLMATRTINDIRLSQATGVPSTTIARLRTNSEANPTVSSLRPIARFFGVSISQLLGDAPFFIDQQCHADTEVVA